MGDQGLCQQPRLCYIELKKENCDSTWNMDIDISSMMRSRLKDMENIARDFIEKLESSNVVEWTEAHHKQLEAIEQAKMAMRHIEDARMKYEKVIQYSSDGVSKFDK